MATDNTSYIYDININGKSYKIKDEYTYNLLLQVEEDLSNKIKKVQGGGGSLTWAHYEDDTEQSGEYMQVCFYDKTKEGFIFSNNADEWNPENLVPQGLVVIPRSHNVYGDGSAGIMSLVNMSPNTPESGDAGLSAFNTDNLLYWGTANPGLTLYNEYPILGNCNYPPQNVIVGVLSGNCFLPNDKWPSGYVCPTDSSTRYFDSNDSSRGWVPGPYNGTKRNPLYYQTTSPASTKNPLSNFDGKGETAIIIKAATGQSDWKTAATIKNTSTSGIYPAACCCYRYKTEYIDSGEWYLPAEGELGYVVPRFNKIEKTLLKLNEIYGNNICTMIEFDATQNYFSSSLNGATSVNRISTLNGSVGTRNATQTAAIRAFTKITPIE